ncbi:MAG: Transcriptional regulator, LysR family [uncultured Caballeronia sp.]|nr:MAG: Transcriptional regulator, LysR family [uncultured Caballeronia sp.]
MNDSIDPADYDAGSATDSLDIWLIRVLQTLLTEHSVTQALLRLGQTQPAPSAPRCGGCAICCATPFSCAASKACTARRYCRLCSARYARSNLSPRRMAPSIRPRHGARSGSQLLTTYLNDFFMPTLIRASRVAAPNARLKIESLTPTLDHERVSMAVGSRANPATCSLT